MIRTGRKAAAIFLSAGLLQLSAGPRAFAVVVKAALPSSGMPVTGAAGASISGRAAAASVSNLFPTIRLSGALPSGGSAPSARLSAPSVQSAASPAAAEASREAGRGTVGEKLSGIARSAAKDIEAAGDLSEASGADSHSVGRRLEDVLTGRGSARVSAAETPVPADGGKGGPMRTSFSREWVEPAEAYASALRIARAAAAKPEFLFAETDIEERDGVLRTAEIRYGFYDLKHETWMRVRVKGTPVAYTLHRDQLFQKFPIRTGAMMLGEPAKTKISLADAVRKARAVMPEFRPVRAMYLKPARGLTDSAGMVHRLVDAKGLVVDVDAVAGIQLWSPAIEAEGAQGRFLSGEVPAPTYKTDFAYFPRREGKPALERFPAQAAGAVAWSAILAGAFLGIGGLFQTSLLGALMPVYLAGAFMALMTYVSGIRTNYHTNEHYVANRKALAVGSMMMFGTMLFGAGALAFSMAGLFPLSLGAMGLMAGTIWATPSLHNPNLMYERAFGEALRRARSLGYADSQLYFGEATASMPVRDGAQWKFSFYAVKEDGSAKGDSILVELDNGISAVWGRYNSRVRVYREASVPADQPLTRFDPARFERGTKIAPEAALDMARAAHADLGGRVSAALQVRKEGERGPRSLWYHFYDEAGSQVSVEAESGEVRVLRKAEKPSLEERREQRRLIKTLRDLDSWMGEHIPLYKVARWVALAGAALWILDMAFGWTAGLPAISVGALGAAAGILAGRPSPSAPSESNVRARKETAVGSTSPGRGALFRKRSRPLVQGISAVLLLALAGAAVYSGFGVSLPALPESLELGRWFLPTGTWETFWSESWRWAVLSAAGAIASIFLEKLWSSSKPGPELSPLKSLLLMLPLVAYEEVTRRLPLQALLTGGFALFLPLPQAILWGWLAHAPLFARLHTYGYFLPRVTGGLLFGYLFLTHGIFTAVLVHALSNLLLIALSRIGDGLKRFER